MTSYVLSWEEFFEIYQDRLPGPSITSFVATVFIAIAVGVFGAVLTYVVDSGDKLVASTFLWLSAVLFLAAFWDLKMRTRQRRERAVKGLKSVHKRFHSSEEAFAFDQEKWEHQTDAGKQEAPWALTSVAETRNMITLAARGHYALVPKRILDPAALETLRGIALGKPGEACPLSVGFSDYILTDVPSLWRRHPFLMAEAHAAGLLFFFMIAAAMYGKTGPGVIWGWALAMLFLLLTISGQFWYFFIKYLTSHKRLRVPWEAEFTQKGMRTKTSGVDGFSVWKNFRTYRETKRSFLLYINLAEYHILPKRCLSPEQQSALRRLLETNLAVD